MVGLSVLVLLFAYDGRIGRLDGLLLAAGLVTYMSWAVVNSRREQAAIKAEYEAEFGVDEKVSSIWASLGNVVLLVVGLALLIVGSRWFVGSAVFIAEELGVSKLVIGLTIVAAGTSLPEVATSLMAAIRGERDIAVGNVVGSNLFNLMCVLGVTGIVSGIRVPAEALRFDLPVMTAVAVACLPIF